MNLRKLCISRTATWREDLCWFEKAQVASEPNRLCHSEKRGQKRAKHRKRGTKDREHFTAAPPAFELTEPQRPFSPSVSSPQATDCPPHTPALLYLHALLLTLGGDRASSEQPDPTGIISPSPWLKAQSCHPYLHISPTQMPLIDRITRLRTTDYTRAQKNKLIFKQ